MSTKTRELQGSNGHAQLLEHRPIRQRPEADIPAKKAQAATSKLNHTLHKDVVVVKALIVQDRLEGTVSSRVEDELLAKR